MDWESQVVSTLKQNDVELVAYLPDGNIAGLIEAVEEDDYFTAVRVAREEEAVGVISGAYLNHTRAALMCQSSGLANSINPIASLNKPARIPFVAFVTRRGDLGEFNLAQVPFGYGMPEVLDAIGIRNHSLDDPETAAETADQATKTAFSTEEPYVLMVETSLTGAKDEF